MTLIAKIAKFSTRNH